MKEKKLDKVKKNVEKKLNKDKNNIEKKEAKNKINLTLIIPILFFSILTIIIFSTYGTLGNSNEKLEKEGELSLTEEEIEDKLTSEYLTEEEIEEILEETIKRSEHKKVVSKIDLSKLSFTPEEKKNGISIDKIFEELEIDYEKEVVKK